ncbi:MAG: putative permease [Clostridiaceae bacterium]|jgi:predicted PurR-regulated permease PerM|nr:putative permease [Clostridiaceae bacterium]
MIEKHPVKVLLIINLVLLALTFLSKMYFLHRFLKVINSSFIIPLLFSTFFYYLLKPINKHFIKKTDNKSLSSALTLTISLFITSGILFYFYSDLLYQFKAILNYLKGIPAQVNQLNGILVNLNQYISIKEIYIMLAGLAEKYMVVIGKYIIAAINSIVSTFYKIPLIIVLLFFLLKDGNSIKYKIKSLFPEEYSSFLNFIISESDATLTAYVNGQAKVALSLSIMIFIGYKIIRLPNSLVLSSITFILAFIPFVGFFISMIIPIIIAFSMGWLMILRLALVFIVVQTLKGRVFVPIIMSKAMKIHPVTDIILVISAVALGGAVAAFAVVPLYAVLKTIIINYNLYCKNK